MPFDRRYIQVKSLSDFAAAEAYARSSPVPLAVHLSNNGMFAIALAGTFSPKAAVSKLAELKAAGWVPADGIVAYGNTYVRKLLLSALIWACASSSRSRPARGPPPSLAIGAGDP